MAGGKGKSHGGKAGPGGKAHAEGVKVQQSHSAKAGLQVSSAYPLREKSSHLLESGHPSSEQHAEVDHCDNLRTTFNTQHVALPSCRRS